MSKRITKTDKNELVETHNICISLNRLAGNHYDKDRWRRALYHALQMSDLRGNDIGKKIREALELP